MLLTISLVAAPAAFSVLERSMAGALVARLFAVEAPTSLVAALAAIVLERWQSRQAGLAPTMNRVWLLALGALFCTVAGYYALQPMMQAARAGQGALSFAALHGISLAFYGGKVLLVAALAWVAVTSARPS